VKNAFTKLGKDISDAEVKQIFQLHDENKDGCLSMAEFEKMLIGCNMPEPDRDDSQLFEK
jgi:Ca2+-binding EF-hand superfamily protein